MLEAIGPGRFGPVYRAREEATGLDAAIKVFDQGLTVEQAGRVASSLEQLAHVSLNHPAIVPVLAAGSLGTRPWLAEPWFDAEPLDALMRSAGRTPAAEALVRLTEAAAALDFAAAVGVHHGALHPHDVLVSHDQTAITGLGVLQVLSDAGLAVPMDGAYVSPQRARGLPVTAADDVYALAAIASVLVAESEDRLAPVLEGALSPEPSQRPPTALALAAALQDALAASPVPFADPPSLPIEQPGADVPIQGFESEVSLNAREPEIPIRPVSVAPPRQSELSLRAAEIDLESESPRWSPAHPPSQRRHEAGSSVWLPATAVLAIGLLGGFAAGYVVGQRDATPPPRSAERPIARDQIASGAARPELPAPTAGRDYTDSTIAPPSGARAGSTAAPDAQPVPDRPVIPPAESTSTGPSEESRVQSPPSQGATSRPASTESGTLHVDSRPRGARVFIDGRLVGTTPIVVSDVAPGTHAVRIDLQGHQRWVTIVEVAPGERHRVAASLER